MKQQQTPARPNQSRPALWRMALPGIVLILVGLILAGKVYQATTETAVSPPSQFSSTLPRTAVDALPEPAAPNVDLPPEVQLDQYLAAGKPTLAFFHSNDCIQCIKMIEVVDQVYPDFGEAVALMDVNVYDQRNANLLRQASIRAIPTMIFIDGAGQGKGYMGFMEADLFRKELQRLVEE